MVDRSLQFQNKSTKDNTRHEATRDAEGRGAVGVSGPVRHDLRHCTLPGRDGVRDEVRIVDTQHGHAAAEHIDPPVRHGSLRSARPLGHRSHVRDDQPVRVPVLPGGEVRTRQLRVCPRSTVTRKRRSLPSGSAYEERGRCRQWKLPRMRLVWVRSTTLPPFGLRSSASL